MIGKLMGLASLGSGLANIRLLQRFLSGVATVIALTIVSAILVGMLVASTFIGIFFLLTHFGLDPTAAAILVIVAVLLLIGLLVNLTLLRIRELRDIPNNAFNFEVPSVAKVVTVVESFIEGFIKDHLQRHRRDEPHHRHEHPVLPKKRK